MREQTGGKLKRFGRLYTTHSLDFLARSNQMAIISRSPAYNLKAVLRETGLKADVLRAWERRYELPKPQRSTGGHRLYSEYDIETLKWLRARQAEGVTISRAVELWRAAIETGQDPLAGYSPPSSPLIPEQLQAAEARIDLLRQNWLKANLAFDSVKVDEVLSQAFAVYPVETVCTEILQKGLSEIGNYWFLDQASAQQEHFASALASRRLEALISATPRPTRPQTVLVGCPPGEWHTFSVLLLSLLLRRRSLGVIYLGADIPTQQTKETAAAIRPSLIVLAAQQLATAASLRSTALALQGTGIALAYGGAIFNRQPILRQRIPGHFLGETLEVALDMIERLAVAPFPAPAVAQPDAAEQELSRRYAEKRPLVESTVMEKLHWTGLQPEYTSQANLYFGNELSAALELGDPSLLEADLEWVKRLLIGRRIPGKEMLQFLAAYQESLDEVMGPASAPITTWLGAYMAQTETQAHQAV
jgi:DNA-binding transcriptional MerR regulator